MKPKFTDGHRYPNGYKPAVDTNIKETFERIKRQRKQNAAEVAAKVEPIKRRTA